jgi:hypothetical protein
MKHIISSGRNENGFYIVHITKGRTSEEARPPPIDLARSEPAAEVAELAGLAHDRPVLAEAEHGDEGNQGTCTDKQHHERLIRQVHDQRVRASAKNEQPDTDEHRGKNETADVCTEPIELVVGIKQSDDDTSTRHGNLLACQLQV